VVRTTRKFIFAELDVKAKASQAFALFNSPPGDLEKPIPVTFFGNQSLDQAGFFGFYASSRKIVVWRFTRLGVL